MNKLDKAGISQKKEKTEKSTHKKKWEAEKAN